MMGVEEGDTIPEWAVRERGQDLNWLGENVNLLLPTAKLAYEESGRGAIVVDTNTLVERGAYQGHPMFYLVAQEVSRCDWQRAAKLVQEYDPSWEFVAVLLKKDRGSAYRIGVPAAKSRNRDSVRSE